MRTFDIAKRKLLKKKRVEVEIDKTPYGIRALLNSWYPFLNDRFTRSDSREDIYSRDLQDYDEYKPDRFERISTPWYFRDRFAKTFRRKGVNRFERDTYADLLK